MPDPKDVFAKELQKVLQPKVNDKNQNKKEELKDKNAGAEDKKEQMQCYADMIKKQSS